MMNIFDAIFRKERFYFNAFDHIAEAVFVCDTQQRVWYMNKASERLDQYKLKDIRGKTVYELYGLDETTSPLLSAIATECPIIDKKYTYYVNGKEIVQMCNAAPIYDDGKLVGGYSIQRDLTTIQEMVEQNIVLQRKITEKKHSPEETENTFSRLIGSCHKFAKCKDMALRAAMNDSTIMLVGDTGSGKELFARAIHEESSRAKKPFLALNCAAIPAGLIEGILFGTKKGVYTGAIEKEGILAQADGGTVFFDELNSMPLESQAKLLRVLEERKIMKLGSDKEQDINIRIISSINKSPQEVINSNHLREDLFYRLSVVQIQIPPLSQRREDIPELTDYFIKKYNKRFNKNISGADSDVLSYFQSFSWPGNVRQLKACIESAMNFAPQCGMISLADLPQYIFDENIKPEVRYKKMPPIKVSSDKISKAPMPRPMVDRRNTGLTVREVLNSCNHEIRLSEILEAKKKEEIIQALIETNGNVSHAAKLLGISRQSLQYRMKKFAIK
ncbi:MAG: sigma 54-interacting transcriptional regulator [Bacillota bacterium]|nr:sigma 54-interacting transcriptional regulator [Bacillota bacterium]